MSVTSRTTYLDPPASLAMTRLRLDAIAGASGGAGTGVHWFDSRAPDATAVTGGMNGFVAGGEADGLPADALRAESLDEPQALASIASEPRASSQCVAFISPMHATPGKSVRYRKRHLGDRLGRQHAVVALVGGAMAQD